LGALLWLLGGTTAFAGNPDERWRTIETEHFFLHYHAPEQDAAERMAAVAERAYDTLSIAWEHDVFLKIHITLRDNSDTANGSATALPFPQVNALVTAPESLSVLEGYDDWIDILITHELTHVFHLDTVHGIPRAVNAVFGFGVLGKLTAPNILQPRWIIEGIATMDESDFSTQGRRRSAQFDAIIRMAVLEGTFQALDQVSSGTRINPHGTSVYLYGVHFMYYLAARYGRDKLAELSHLYGGRIVPFGINRAAQDVFGVDFYTLWDEFKRDTTRRFRAQARRIRSRGLRQGVRMTMAGESTRYPVWSADDDWIYFYRNDGHREEGLKRLPATGGRFREGVGIGRQGVDLDVEHVIDIEDSAEASFVGATGDVVFGQTSVYDYRYRWSDLYRYNGGDPRQAERLTFGLRASEPHVSADGRTVVFRRNDVAQSRLAFLDLATADVVEVAPQGRISQVYTPRWHPDGQRVAYSGFREGGYRDIYIYDRRDGSTTRVTADRHLDMSPTWSPDGRYLVFTSDRDEVYNIYAYDMQTRRLHQVSNVLGGAFEPAVSHDGTRVAYVGYGAYGYDLWVMDFDPDKWLEAMPTVSDLQIVDDNKPPLTQTGERPPALASRRYQPIRTFFPRLIAPSALDFAALSGGGSLLGFATGLSDIVGFHSLGLTFNYLTQPRIATGSAVYSYRRLFPDFTISAGRGYSERGGFRRFVYDRPIGVADGYQQDGYRERSTFATVDMSLPALRNPRHRADVALSYSFNRLKNLDAGQAPIDPNAPSTSFPEVGDLASVTARASYSSESDGSGRFTYGAERGRSASVSVSVLDERLGGDYGDLQGRATYREIIPMPWRGHQSLVLSLRGGAAQGGLARRGAFCVGNYISGIDVVQALIQRTPSGQACNLLRGYETVAQAGQFFSILTGEYRIPIVDLDRGIGTAPFFLQRVGFIPFVDYGGAWDGPIGFKELLVGAGGALVISMRMGYVEPIHLLLQFDHGFDGELGTDVFRAVVAGSF
jgi:Tol biopolymer transport system component